MKNKNKPYIEPEVAGMRSKRLFGDEMKHQVRMGILSNLFSAVALILIILLGNSFYTGEAQKYTRDQVIETMSKVSVAMSASFSDHWESLYEELSVVGQFVSLHKFSLSEQNYYDEVCDYLSKIKFNKFDDVGVLTEDGLVILSSGGYYEVSQDTSVAEYLSTRPHHSCITPEIDALDDSLVFVVHYDDEQNVGNHPIAGILGVVNKSTIASLLETDAFGANFAYVVISDEHGNVITDTASKRSFGSNLLTTFEGFADSDTVASLARDLIDGKENIVELMGVTERFLMYYAPIERQDSTDSSVTGCTTYNWRLLILTSTSSLNKNIVEFSEKSMILLYSSLGVMTLLLLGIGILLGYRSRRLLVIRSTDSLTGLLNSKRFKADANLIIRNHGEKYTVLSVNIVRFRMINGKYGHIKADKILRAVGNNIKQFLRDDEITARTYSDHFAVLLNTDTPQGEERIEELMRYLTDATYPFDSKLLFTIGAYRIKSEDTDIVVPLDNARHAQQSLNRVGISSSNIIYCDEQSIKDQHRAMVLAEMAPASLANNEFVVYYQLKRGVGKDGTWVGCEALVRWQNDIYGFISPGVFIDLFEKNGFITKMDLYVFETVCRDLKRSINEGKRVVPVSFNVSKVHFDEKDFLKDYESILRKYDIPGELIEFEITESFAANNNEHVQNALEEIHRMGCRCAIDDFGTGYSSFDMIINFSIDTIKLDASLFRGSPAKMESRKETIKTLIDLSHKLNMKVVAEGIETEEQAAFLEQSNCDAIQGFLYARPVPYKDFRAAIDAEQPPLK